MNEHMKFLTPPKKLEMKGITSLLPNGRAWLAKVIEGTGIRSLVSAISAGNSLLRSKIEEMVREFNMETAVDGMPFQERSVGLPDYRLPVLTDIEDRRKLLIRRYSNDPVRTITEIQEYIDFSYPGYGIWVENGGDPGNGFRYEFRSTFDGYDASLGLFVINVYIPKWITLGSSAGGPNAEVLTKYIVLWMRDFIPANVLINPIEIEEPASYCVIINPPKRSTVYPEYGYTQTSSAQLGDGDNDLVDGAGSNLVTSGSFILRYEKTLVWWRSIDVDGTVIDYEEYVEILATDTVIERSFVDSEGNTITGTRSIRVVVLIEEDN